MNRFIKILAFSSSLVLLSCSQPKVEKLLSNTEKLMAIPDSLPVLSLDYTLPKDSLLKFVYDTLSPDACIENLEYGLKLSNGKIIKVQTWRKCDNTVRCGFRGIKRLFLNKDNYLLHDGRFCKLDDLFIELISPDSQNYSSFGSEINLIRFKWQKGASAERIERTISILDSFRFEMKKIQSKDIFRVPLDSLNKHEFQKIQEKSEPDIFVIKGFEEMEITPLPPKDL